MNDSKKTKAQLVEELAALRQWVGELETGFRQAKEKLQQESTIRKAELLQQVRNEVWKMESSEDLLQVLVAVREGLQELRVPFQYCSVNLVDESTDPVVIRAHTMDSQGQWRQRPVTLPGTPLLLGVWRKQEVLYRSDLEKEDLHKERVHLRVPLRAVVDIPFSHGTLAISSTEPNAFSSDDIEILQAMAGVLSEGFQRQGDFLVLEQRNRDLETGIMAHRETEERVTRSEKRYRTLVETPPDLGVMLLDENGRYLYVNPQVEEWTGFPAAAFYENQNIGKQITHPDDYEAEELAFYQAVKGMSVPKRMFRWKSKDGNYRWASGYVVPIYNDEECVENVQVVFQDITERKQAEERLKENERLLKAYHQIGRTILSTMDLDEIIKSLAEQIVAVGIFRSLAVSLVNEEYRYVEQVLSLYLGGNGFEWSGGDPSSLHPLDDKDILAETARTGEMQVAVGWDDRFTLRPGMEKEEFNKGQVAFFIPVKQEGRVVAVLATGSTIDEKEETLHRIEIMEPLLDQFAIALEHARLYEIAQEEIAEREHVEETLRESEERVRLLIERLPIGITHNTPDGQFLLYNPHAQSITGYTLQDLPAMKAQDLYVHPEDREELLRNLQEKGEHTFEYPLRHKDGREIWVRGTTRAIKNEEGKLIELEGYSEDITERKQIEQEKAVALALHRVRNEILQMENEDDWHKVQACFHRELSQFVEYDGLGINLIDRQNETYSAYGVNVDDKTSYDFLPESLQVAIDSQAPVYRHNRAEIEQFGNKIGLERNSVVDVPFRGGTIGVSSNAENAFSEADIRILGQFSSLMSEGNRRIEDITERKQMEQELIHLERLRAVGELSAGVSHNLNNILTNVLGPAQLLKRKTDDPELLREADDIITSAGRARDLVHELHLSVRTAGEETLYPVVVDEVVQQAVKTSRPRWKDETEAQGIPINVETHWEDVPPIRGTEAGLHDILINFIFNAVDAMPEGGTITIRTERVENRVQITFSDTGTGMDEETRRRVFEPFFTTKMDVGSGLGLSTAYNTVRGWGGSIEVNSILGERTTFILRFPVWTEEVTEEQEKAIDAPQTRSGKILVIDDDEAVCSLLSRLLGERHTVETSTDGGKALDRFAPGKYDVVLIDLGMSGISGDQVLKQVKEIDPQVATVLITGWDLPDSDMRVTAFDFRVQKPFDDLDEVEEAVAQAIELQDQRAEKRN